MKKAIGVVIALIILAACTIDPPIVSDYGYHSFEDVSSQYLDTYGAPEEVSEYISPTYHSISWWWWSAGFCVDFESSIYDEVYGWRVSSTYTFEPIQ